MFELPYKIKVGSRTYYINLNSMHRIHFMVRYKIKKEYTRILKRQFTRQEEAESLLFFIVKKPTLKVDIDNLESYHKKYFQDAYFGTDGDYVIKSTASFMVNTDELPTSKLDLENTGRDARVYMELSNPIRTENVKENVLNHIKKSLKA